MNQNKQVRFRDLGTIDYRAAWDLQEEVFAGIVSRKVRNRGRTPEQQQPIPNYLFFCEHPPVYTLGKSGQPDHLLLDEAGLARYGATFHRINRGGDITFHGPGQLVVYPLLDLENFLPDIHHYLRTLEEAVIRTLAEYGLAAGRIPGLTGVWLDYEAQPNPRKICALGVKASRWVTMHGLALNVNTDLSYFGHIVPCGIADKGVTSLARELGRPPDVREVAHRLLNHLGDLFGMELVMEGETPLAPGR
ncbi:MAG: lipoyl(octanoyl) transferase LipB [Ferruginibacter sp.]|nr:lipoyl(octanoyl) transferase LipB [Cytophagales bacterium]